MTPASPAVLDRPELAPRGKPSRSDPRDPLVVQLFDALASCVAWMDAPHRATDLSNAIVEDARALLRRVLGQENLASGGASESLPARATRS